MGHWKTCPYCGVQTVRCAYEDEGPGEPCEYSCWRPFAGGFDAAILLFWRAVCEQKAQEAERRAARVVLPETRAAWVAAAAQLRVWANA